jgi:hypothetical protein
MALLAAALKKLRESARKQQLSQEQKMPWNRQ